MPATPPADADPIVHLAFRRARIVELRDELIARYAQRGRAPSAWEAEQGRALAAALAYVDDRIARIDHGRAPSTRRPSGRRLDGRVAQMMLRAESMPTPIPVDAPPRPRRKFDYDRPGMPAPIAPLDVLRPGGSWRRTLGALGPNGR
jgi:hypothetical protein